MCHVAYRKDASLLAFKWAAGPTLAVMGAAMFKPLVTAVLQWPSVRSALTVCGGHAGEMTTQLKLVSLDAFLVLTPMLWSPTLPHLVAWWEPT